MINSITLSVNCITHIYPDDKYKLIWCIQIIAFIPCNYIYGYFHIVNCGLEHNPRMDTKWNTHVIMHVKAHGEEENVTIVVTIQYRLYLVLHKDVWYTFME